MINIAPVNNHFPKLSTAFKCVAAKGSIESNGQGFPMLKQFFFVLLFAGVVSQAQAARVWEIQDNYVEDVAMYLDMVGTTSYNVLSVKLKNPISTGCALTDSTKTVTWWNSTDANFAVSMWYSTLLSAQAQGLKVDIRTDNANCNASYGRLFLGARVKSK